MRPTTPLSLCMFLASFALLTALGPSRAALAQPAVATPRAPKRAAIDEETVRAAGISQHRGERLTLYTDLRDADACEALVRLFDAAYPQWCRYFNVAEQVKPAWHVTAHLMLDREKFRTAGLLPDELPDFAHGYTLHDRFWLDEQPSEYYRRHLLLHEGTHSFMFTRLGSCGPAWYMEGTAELLATHRLDDTGLTLAYFPQSREEVPMLGRIKLVRDDVNAGRVPRRHELLNLSPRENSGYAWAWAWATFLDSHPRYRERFRALIPHVRDEDFNARFEASYRGELDDIDIEWEGFARELDYGRDLARTPVMLDTGKMLTEPGKPIEKKTITVSIATDRGWQSTGVMVVPGVSYRLRAQGRYQLVAGPPVWWSEPGGVTIRYHRGMPLGMLQAAIAPDLENPGGSERIEPVGLHLPIPVGLEASITTTLAGTLYLRVNDSPAELSDNEGTVEVEITQALP